MKSEFRKSKSERIPKSKIRSIASRPFRAAGGKCLPGLAVCSLGCLTRQPFDSGFGLRTSGFFRHSVFGIRICAIARFAETLNS
jgi:hypothetical protein